MLPAAREGRKFTFEAQYPCAEVPRHPYLALPGAAGMNDFIQPGGEPEAENSYRRLWINERETPLRPAVPRKSGIILLMKGALAPGQKRGLPAELEFSWLSSPNYLTKLFDSLLKDFLN